VNALFIRIPTSDEGNVPLWRGRDCCKARDVVMSFVILTDHFNGTTCRLRFIVPWHSSACPVNDLHHQYSLFYDTVPPPVDRRYWRLPAPPFVWLTARWPCIVVVIFVLPFVTCWLTHYHLRTITATIVILATCWCCCWLIGLLLPISIFREHSAVPVMISRVSFIALLSPFRISFADWSPHYTVRLWPCSMIRL